MESLMSGTRLNLTIPEQLADFARRRAKSGGFTSTGDFLRHLLREEHSRELAQLNAMIQDGIDSGPSKRTPKQIFAAIDKELDVMEKTQKRSKTKA